MEEAGGAYGTGREKQESLKDRKEESKETDMHEQKSQPETSQCWK